METIVRDLEVIRRDSLLMEGFPRNVQDLLTVLAQSSPQEPGLFCRRLGELWLLALSNRVLRRKLGKLVDKCCGVYPDTMDGSILQCLHTILSRKRIPKALMDVSLAIESSMAACKCLEKLWIAYLTFLRRALEELCSDLEIQDEGCDTRSTICSSTERNNTFVIAAKVFLQLVQLYPHKFGSALSGKKEEETGSESYSEQKEAIESLQGILNHILLVLQSQVSPKDAVIFCGTALALLENVCVNQRAATSLSALLSRSFDVQFILFGETRISVPAISARNSYSSLAIASGLLNVGHRDVLLRLVPDADEVHGICLETTAIQQFETHNPEKRSELRQDRFEEVNFGLQRIVVQRIAVQTILNDRWRPNFSFSMGFCLYSG